MLVAAHENSLRASNEYRIPYLEEVLSLEVLKGFYLPADNGNWKKWDNTPFLTATRFLIASSILSQSSLLTRVVAICLLISSP